MIQKSSSPKTYTDENSVCSETDKNIAAIITQPKKGDQCINE